MHKVLANKNGGQHLELTPDEEKAVLKEWAQNNALQVAETTKHLIRERIPSTDRLAMLHVKAQYGSDAQERQQAQEALRAALAAQKELDAFE